MSPEASKWHKEIATACNNRAWSLCEQARNPEQDREMLNTAHASAYHWGLIGTELNRMRANMLLAQVHALLGHGATAFALASEVRTYFFGKTDTPDWELAFTHAIHAHAAYVCGESALHAASYQHARDAIAAIGDEEDRQIVMKTFATVPPP